MVKYYHLKVVADGTELKSRRVVSRLFHWVHVNHLAVARGFEQQAMVAVGYGLEIERGIRRRRLGLKE